MNKYKYYFLIFLFILGFTIGQIINVIALSDSDYIEEINPIRNSFGDIIGEDIIITIPKNYNKRHISINTSIIDGYYHYSNNDSEFIVNIIINNESDYDYKYINDSFMLNSSDKMNSDYYIYNIMYDDYIIHDSYYRSYNEALTNLVTDSLELSDEIIDLYLKNNGYTGINELNKYYYDYYGNDYSFNKIITGKVSNYKETNTRLIKEAYWYYYNNIMYYSCSSNINNLINYNCNNIFSIINKNSRLSISNMKIVINKNDCFNNYRIYEDFYFDLSRV